MWDGMGLEGGCSLFTVTAKGLKRLGLPLLPGKAQAHLHVIALRASEEGKKQDLGGHWGSPGSQAGGSEETWPQGFWLEILALES